MIYLMIIEIQEEKFNRETKILHIVKRLYSFIILRIFKSYYKVIDLYILYLDV